MPGSCKVVERPATPDELASVQGRAEFWPELKSWAFLLVAISPFLAPGVAFLVNADSVWMTLLGLGLISVAAWIVVDILRSSRRLKQCNRRDGDGGSVEVITVEGASPVQIDDDYSGLMFAFDLSEGRLLVLEGAWLMDPRTFGEAGDEDEDSADGYANLLRPPCAFPCSSFRVHRFPGSGIVLRIEILSDYKAPEQRIEVGNLQQLNLSTSYFGPGSVDDLSIIRRHDLSRS